MIPQDPIILLSYVNTQLRDKYKTLSEFAEGFDLSENDIKGIVEKLNSAGFSYDEDANQFK